MCWPFHIIYLDKLLVIIPPPPFSLSVSFPLPPGIILSSLPTPQSRSWWTLRMPMYMYCPLLHVKHRLLDNKSSIILCHKWYNNSYYYNYVHHHTQKKPRRSYTIICKENQYTMIITMYSWFSSQWHIVLTNDCFAILIIHSLWYIWFRRSAMLVYKRLIAEIKHLPSL